MQNLIAIEGADAVGKEAQTKLLVDWLRERNHAVLPLSFPRYRTHLGRLIRAHLLRNVVLAENAPTITGRAATVLPDPSPYDSLMFQCLMTADKYEAVPEIVTHINDGGVVVTDRWWPSAYAYGCADGVDSAWLFHVHERLPQAALNILIELPHDEARKRRPRPDDRYEEDAAKQLAVRDHYKTLWNYKRVKGDPKAWAIVDGRASIEDVHAQIIEHVRITHPTLCEDS